MDPVSWFIVYALHMKLKLKNREFDFSSSRYFSTLCCYCYHAFRLKMLPLIWLPLLCHLSWDLWTYIMVAEILYCGMIGLGSCTGKWSKKEEIRRLTKNFNVWIINDKFIFYCNFHLWNFATKKGPRRQAPRQQGSPWKNRAYVALF